MVGVGGTYSHRVGGVVDFSGRVHVNDESLPGLPRTAIFQRWKERRSMTHACHFAQVVEVECT
jgi:hypothetical protein